MCDAKCLDDIRNLIKNLPYPDKQIKQAIIDRESLLVKPYKSLGILEDLTLWIAQWQDKKIPRMLYPCVTIFTGHHGISCEGISAFPDIVNRHMIKIFRNNGAAINQICKTVDSELQIIEMNNNIPTKNFLFEPAMNPQSCLQAILCGFNSVQTGIDLFIPGEMGIGNTTSAAAITYALFGGNVSDWTGTGTGINRETLMQKYRIVQDSVFLHKKYMHDGLDILCYVGGYEIAAILGAIISARLKKIPVLLDGYVSCSAAAILSSMNPTSLDHCQVSHISAEKGHRNQIKKLKKKAFIDFKMRLGEGSGAALMIPILRAAVNCHNGMDTLEKAGIKKI